jgi:dihydroorotase
MSNYLIKNTTIVNEGRRFVGDVLIKDGRIEKIASSIDANFAVEEIDGTGQFLLPGAIDDQVHFREPGLTHKANIYTEAKAAVAGGTTSFMEMPNTNPPVFTQELLEDKYQIAASNALANYSFFMGTSQDNVEEILKTNAKKNEVCGVKIFMGSSTGNLLVDNPIVLERIFEGSELLIATHCEEEAIIKKNKANLEARKAILEPSDHPIIRDVDACFESSFKAIQLAKKFDTRLHILHISTAKELQLFSNLKPLAEKRITAEVCVHHLHFTADDYAAKGNLIKCNPAIKSAENRTALWEGLLNDQLDIIATDHAPHTWEEKQQAYPQSPSGLPLVQHSLQLMLQYAASGKISYEKVIDKMCHKPAECFQLKQRGYIREGYFADLVMVNPNKNYQVTKDNILYKCGWSPLLGNTFNHSIEKVWVNGVLGWDGQLTETYNPMRLQFDR